MNKKTGVTTLNFTPQYVIVIINKNLIHIALGFQICEISYCYPTESTHYKSERGPIKCGRGWWENPSVIKGGSSGLAGKSHADIVSHEWGPYAIGLPSWE